MELSAQTLINRPVELVWNQIIDIRNSAQFIEGIIKIEVLEEPENTRIGFKWKETRMMFGKEATEIMWITEYKENEYYQTRAESHGSVYISRMAVEEVNSQTQLTMSFKGEPQTFMAKIFSKLMGAMMKGSMKKIVLKDLADIKVAVEAK